MSDVIIIYDKSSATNAPQGWLGCVLNFKKIAVQIHIRKNELIELFEQGMSIVDSHHNPYNSKEEI